MRDVNQPPDAWPPGDSELPRTTFRPLYDTPNPFKVLPCCAKAKGKVSSSRHGPIVVLDVAGGEYTENDVKFCPWCGKRFKVRRKGPSFMGKLLRDQTLKEREHCRLCLRKNHDGAALLAEAELEWAKYPAKQ